MPAVSGGAYLASVFPRLNLKIPEPPFFVFTRVLKILGAVVLAPLYRSLRRSGSLSIHPPVRIGTAVSARGTTAKLANRRRLERARRWSRSGASGKRGVQGEGEKERKRESETGALEPQTETRRDRTSRHARCGNDRTSTKRPTRSLIAQLRARRASCRIVYCCVLRGSRDATQPAVANRARALHQHSLARSLVRFLRPPIPSSLDFSIMHELCEHHEMQPLATSVAS